MTKENRLTTGRCANCKTTFPHSERYVVFASMVWCDEDCVAEYYVEHEERFLRNGTNIKDVANRLEVRDGQNVL